MDVEKSYQSLKHLYKYGESGYDNSLSYLERYGLFKRTQNKTFITNNWINYGIHVQDERDPLLSLFLFNDDYKKYLIEISLLTALKMRKAEDTEGIQAFVNKLSKISSYLVFVLTEIKDENDFSISCLEERLKKKEEQYQDLNHLIFEGFPHYQRIMYYLKYVQAYKQEDIKEDVVLGNKIDEQWQKGRKISTDLSLTPLKEQTLYTLVPFIPKRKIEPRFKQIFTYPWELFVFLCCIVRENNEAQGVQAIRFQVIGYEVNVLLTANNYQQYHYGSFDEFAIEFCKVSQYQLFPKEVSNLQSVFHKLVEQKLLTILDDEYRIPTAIEDVIYNTSVFIPLIAESKQLRGRMEKWIDELREKR